MYTDHPYHHLPHWCIWSINSHHVWRTEVCIVLSCYAVWSGNVGRHILHPFIDGRKTGAVVSNRTNFLLRWITLEAPTWAWFVLPSVVASSAHCQGLTKRDVLDEAVTSGLKMEIQTGLVNIPFYSNLKELNLSHMATSPVKHPVTLSLCHKDVTTGTSIRFPPQKGDRAWCWRACGPNVVNHSVFTNTAYDTQHLINVIS